jgi:SiaC family regulatory phosphoprotein
MKIFKKANTESTPEVEFNFESKKLSIKGVCSPENPTSFFLPIYSHLEEYKETNDELLIEFMLDYFNTASSKCILNLLFNLKSNPDKKFNCKINWFIVDGDDEMKECGELYEELTKLKFNYIAIN